MGSSYMELISKYPTWNEVWIKIQTRSFWYESTQLNLKLMVVGPEYYVDMICIIQNYTNFLFKLSWIFTWFYAKWIVYSHISSFVKKKTIMGFFLVWISSFLELKNQNCTTWVILIQENELKTHLGMTENCRDSNTMPRKHIKLHGLSWFII